MTEPSRPLQSHVAFSTSRFDQLAGTIEAQLGATFRKRPPAESRVAAEASFYKLPQGELWYCAYGMPLSLDFPDGDYLRLQMQYKGAGATLTNHSVTAITPSQACISSAEVGIDFGPGFEQLVWRIPKGRLEQTLSVISDQPVRHALAFDPALDLMTDRAATLRPIMACMLQAIDAAADGAKPSAASRVVLAELEQAFIATILATAGHSGRGLLEAPAPSAAPWQVRRAESHIEANWNQAITIEDLANVSGTSARSLFRTFKQSRGYSPLEFARRLRLNHARGMLEKPEAATTVTDVAFACGFSDLSRFSKDFVRTFGKRPSAILADARNETTATAPLSPEKLNRKAT